MTTQTMSKLNPASFRIGNHEKVRAAVARLGDKRRELNEASNRWAELGKAAEAARRRSIELEALKELGRESDGLAEALEEEVKLEEQHEMARRDIDRLTEACKILEADVRRAELEARGEIQAQLHGQLRPLIEQLVSGLKMAEEAREALANMQRAFEVADLNNPFRVTQSDVRLGESWTSKAVIEKARSVLNQLPRSSETGTD